MNGHLVTQDYSPKDLRHFRCHGFTYTTSRAVKSNRLVYLSFKIYTYISGFQTERFNTGNRALGQENVFTRKGLTQHTQAFQQQQQTP